MILYHGSFKAIEKPDIAYSRKLVDFGAGFYATPFREQAVNWALHFKSKSGKAVVSSYGFLQKPAAEALPPDTRILEFDTHSLEWLDFITACRLGRSADEGFDLIMGGVANDKVFDALQLYFDGLLTAEEAVKRLRYNKPNFQYCFKSQWIIDGYLHFIKAEEF